LDVLAQVSQAHIEELLLVVGDLSNRVNLLHTVGAELDVGGEVLASLILVQGRVDECRLNDVLLALSSLKQALSKARTSHSHGESSGTGTILSLDDLVTTELYAADVLGELFLGEVEARLAEEGNNGGTRVAANNGYVLVGRVGVAELGDEARGTDNVEGGHTEEALGVIDTLGLENLGGDGNGGVDLEPLVELSLHNCYFQYAYRVGDDEDIGLGGVVGNGLSQVADDRGVGVEQI
jgi:hypothetical protein